MDWGYEGICRKIRLFRIELQFETQFPFKIKKLSLAVANWERQNEAFILETSSTR